MSDVRVETMVLYAWVGEDELGSGEVGLKQAVVPAGTIAMVACKEGKIDQPYIVEQMRRQAKAFGKTIRLCRFVYAGEVLVLEPKPRQHMWRDGECAVCGYPPDSPEGREPCSWAGGQS